MSRSYKIKNTNLKDKKFLSFFGAKQYLKDIEGVRIPVKAISLFEFPTFGLDFEPNSLPLSQNQLTVGEHPKALPPARTEFFSPDIFTSNKVREKEMVPIQRGYEKKNKSKFYRGDDGELIIIDPREEDIPTLKKISPGFEVLSVRPESYTPKLRRTVASGLIQEKIKQAKKELMSCRLCAWECGVNRYSKAGKCGLREDAYLIDHFVHVNEEGPLCPTWYLKLAGCSWRCCYCLSPEVFDIERVKMSGKVLDKDLWGSNSWERVNSIEFTNPNESLPAVLEFLSSAPDHLSAPIVWKDTLFGSRRAYDLADGLVDVFLPDLRFWSESCAERLSGVDGYQAAVREAIESMLKQNVRILARILILPGHVNCCHIPSLKWLSQYRDSVFVSILDSYIPAHRASEHLDMARSVTEREVREVKETAERLGLRDVNKNPELFWK